VEAGEWQAAMFVEHGVLAVIQMMQDNQAEDGFEEVSKLMLRDRKKWWTQASEMTRKYAL
jgi:ubiquitin-protein ligase